MTSVFLEDLARARPDPGGGAAAAHGAALGLALLEKVAQLECRRAGRDNPERNGWENLLGRVRQARSAMFRLQDEDVQAYLQLARARESGHSDELLPALEEATDCPRRIMHQGQEALALLSVCGAGCQKHLVSDLLVALEFLGAAVKGAHHIACANLPLMPDESRRQALAGRLFQSLSEVETIWVKVRDQLLDRIDAADHCRR